MNLGRTGVISVIWGIMLFMAIIAVLVALWISNNIARSIVVLSKAADEIAKGNLSITYSVRNNDEIGRLANSITTMVGNTCPATTDNSSDGLNSGKNGGRICWAVTGTFCGGKVQGTFADKRLTCITCDVFKMVQAEEDPMKFSLLKPGQVFKPHQ